MTHRDEKLDSLTGKRVKIIFKDGDILVGKLVYDSVGGLYGLQNCVDERRGFARCDTYFRKSHIQKTTKVMI